MIRGILLTSSEIFHWFKKIGQQQKLNTVTVGNEKTFKFSCKGEFLVMQDEMWLEFWKLGVMVCAVNLTYFLLNTFLRFKHL